jgi:DNA polymerase III sliding clamp (beta) subunit (PCNA family)
MDFETVLPLKTVNDIIKEVKEGEETPVTECGCGNCTCK